MIIILASGKQVDLKFPSSLLDLTNDEYNELLSICREQSKRKVA